VEVTKLVGVSWAVSRTFTSRASVSKKIRKKVIWAAQQLNYHVNHLVCELSKIENHPVCRSECIVLGKILNILTKQFQFDGNNHIQLDYQSTIFRIYSIFTRGGCQKLAIIVHLKEIS